MSEDRDKYWFLDEMIKWTERFWGACVGFGIAYAIWGPK